MSAHIPKAVLYYNPNSVWSSSALLALEEKGYGVEEVELKVVDIGKGENLSTTFLRINPKGTIPTLVVPLEKTLSPDDEHRFKAVTDTKSVVEFLDKSRSSISRTHTVSSAPAPALAPATIALSSTSSSIIDLLHSEDGDPNSLFHSSALNATALRTAANTFVPFLKNRLEAIDSYISGSQKAEIQASEKTRKLWESKKAHSEELLAVYSASGKDDDQLTPDEKSAREAYFRVATEYWTVRLRRVLTTLDKEIIGPFALGDQISITDLHLGPWLARIAFLSGGLASDTGDAIVTKIEQRVGDNFALPKDFQTFISPDLNADPSLTITPGAKRAKLAAFWDEMKMRPSWKKVYGDKLH